MAEALGKVFDERTTRRIDHFGKDAVPMGQGVVQLIEPLAGFGPLTKFGTGVVHGNYVCGVRHYCPLIGMPPVLTARPFTIVNSFPKTRPRIRFADMGWWTRRNEKASSILK
ncbi:hypothetical protein NZL82_18210 [Sphingomonas sanguinis]|nr:hypothetical protein [Sphingomonas sp. LC-1]